VRWGHEPTSALRKPVIALISSKFGSWVIRKLTPVDRQLLRRSNGRFTILGPVGVLLLLLTTVGRKSGARRDIRLTYMREGDRLFRKFADYAANYDAYRGRTDRELRVFELTRR